MGEFKRKSDGRRILTSDFKRATVDRIRSGSAMLAELSRELEISPTILRNWLRLVLGSGALKKLSDDGVGEQFAWMPDQARVLYFTASGKLMIQDIATLERREVGVTLPLPPEPDFNLLASPDGRTLYYEAQQTEANIWKVEVPQEAGQ